MPEDPKDPEDKDQEDELEEQLEADLAKDLKSITIPAEMSDKIFRTETADVCLSLPSTTDVPQKRSKKSPTLVGEPFEIIMLKLLKDGATIYHIEKNLRKIGYPDVSKLALDYYAKFYAGRYGERFLEVCRMHRDMLEYSLNGIKEKLGNNTSSLQQINYYISVLSVEIEIVRNYTPELGVGDREELLEKLIGRVQNLMTLKNKYISDLDRKDNVKKVLVDVVGIAADTLLHDSLTPEQKKELLDKFKLQVKEYVGFIE